MKAETRNTKPERHLLYNTPQILRDRARERDNDVASNAARRAEASDRIVVHSRRGKIIGYVDGWPSGFRAMMASGKIVGTFAASDKAREAIVLFHKANRMAVDARAVDETDWREKGP